MSQSKQVQENPSKEFWDNKPFLIGIDMVARRYGKLPSEITALSVFDFMFNMAVMVGVIDQENQQSGGPQKPQGTEGLANFGVAYEVKEG